MKFNSVVLGDVAEVTKLAGFEFTKYIEYNDTGEIIALRALNLRDGKLDLTDIKRIDRSVSEKLPRSKLYINDILLTYTGNGYGDCAIVEENDKYHLAPNICKIVPNTDKINPYYLYSVIRSKYFYQQMTNYIGGSSQPTIPMKTIRVLQIPYPEIAIQTRIATILQSINRKIVLNTKINENLEQQAQAIFKSWFVDFEPFGGVMPDDWRLGTFSDIIESTLGGDWGKETSTGNYTERVYCIRGADIPEVKAGNKGKMPTRYILPKNFKNKKLIANDIVVEISGGSPTQSTGRVAAISQSLLDRYDCGMVCTNFCRAIKPCEGYSYYTYYYWQYLYDRNVFFSYENGTTGIKNLDLSGFVETESIIIPSIKAIQEFNSLIDSFHSRVFKNGQENENIAALRDTLLPKLMNGEIDVSKVRI